MFNQDRFSLTRFSLGLETIKLPIDVSFSDELKELCGAAIPVPSTLFVNDVIRGSMRGAIAIKCAFESDCSLYQLCKMNANICIYFDEEEIISSITYGSRNENIVALLADELNGKLHGSKTIPYMINFSDEVESYTNGVMNRYTDWMLNEVMTSLMEAVSQTTEIARVDITIPPGSELRIDSETFRAMLDGENILYAQNGDWLTLTRELMYIDIESATGGSLEGMIIYTERYL